MYKIFAQQIYLQIQAFQRVWFLRSIIHMSACTQLSILWLRALCTSFSGKICMKVPLLMFPHFFVHILFVPDLSSYNLLMLVLLFLVVEKFVSVVDPDGYSTSPCSGKSISCTWESTKIKIYHIPLVCNGKKYYNSLMYKCIKRIICL